MQMYLWTGTGGDGFVTVGGVDRSAYGSTFGAALTLAGTSGALAVYDDGVVRASFVHYNTPAEIERLIGVLETVL